MNELYFAMREWWGGFINIETEPNTFIPALLETEISRKEDGTPKNITAPYIIYEIADLSFGVEVMLQARIFSRVIGNPDYIAPVLHVQDQFRERLMGKTVMFNTSRGGVVMGYRGTRTLPLPADETRQGWVCGLMQYSLINFRK